MSPKRLVFDSAFLVRLTKDKGARKKFISDNYGLLSDVFNNVLLRYGLPDSAREDIVQDSIIKLWAALGNGNFNPERIKGGDLGRWALSIPINKAKDLLDSPRNPREFDSLDTVCEDKFAEGDGHGEPTVYFGTNRCPVGCQQFARQEHDWEAYGKLFELVEIYGTHPKTHYIASLLLDGYSLEVIADELGLSYSNIRQIWSRFKRPAREGEETLKRIQAAIDGFDVENFLPIFKTLLSLPRSLPSPCHNWGLLNRIPYENGNILWDIAFGGLGQQVAPPVGRDY